MKSKPEQKRREAMNFTMYMVVGLGLTVLMSAASIMFGAADMRLATVWEAIFRFDPMLTEHQIIQTMRLPRTVADLIVGCSLAVCGAIMQGQRVIRWPTPGSWGLALAQHLQLHFAWPFCRAIRIGR